MTNSAMLHLAQVKKNLATGGMEVELLASLGTNNTWEVSRGTQTSAGQALSPRLSAPTSLPLKNDNLFVEGLLVLVEEGKNEEIISIKDAKDWVLDLVENYLAQTSITSEFVDREQQRVEQWRQEIALESQDLTCKRLEIETRRDELQDIFESLQQQREELELEREALKAEREELEGQKTQQTNN